MKLKLSTNKRKSNKFVGGEDDADAILASAKRLAQEAQHPNPKDASPDVLAAAMISIREDAKTPKEAAEALAKLSKQAGGSSKKLYSKLPKKE